MSILSNYWHLQRLDSAGHCQRHRLPPAHTWLQRHHPTLADGDGRMLQGELFDQWRQAPAQMMMALLCLRCWVSHGIRQACVQLAGQFGDYYQFQRTDLFPYVLDDDGKPLGSYRPLSVYVVETYTPGQASLESWAMHLTRNHPELNQFLLERGLYRVSDWAILNDTQPSQLLKILGEFHGLTATEVTTAQQLLHHYHRVYRRDRLQAGQPRSRRRCLPPTRDQLGAIDPTQSPDTVLAHLQQLAYWLRQYRVQRRGGTLPTESLDALPRDLPAPAAVEDDPQAVFLQRYRQQLEASLQTAIATTLRAYCTQLRRKSPPKAQAFCTALHLFHCQGESMGAIAPQVGLSSQVQVSRLLNLKQFRADVRNALLTDLRRHIQDAVLTVTSAAQLEAMGDRLDAALAAEGDRLMAAAAAEAQVARDRPARSLFAQTLCRCLADGVAEDLTVDPMANLPGDRAQDAAQDTG